MRVWIVIDDRALPEGEETVPAVGDLVEFVNDHDERRWLARITERRFFHLPTETIVEMFAEPEAK